MDTKTRLWSLVPAALASGLLISGTATAAAIDCTDPTSNYMQMDDSQAAACLASGDNNPSFTGSNTDIFLSDDPGDPGFGYQYIDKSEGADQTTGVYDLKYTQSLEDSSEGAGTWEFDSSLWSNFDTIALGFKFGAGEQGDNWFVYELMPNVSDGNWAYFGKGPGLSNIALYGKESVSVPEPGTLGLLGLGLVGFTLARRKNRAS